nr:lysylphosphatidylglycerol synthase domain-containing protein [Acetobacter thailandicus]
MEGPAGAFRADIKARTVKKLTVFLTLLGLLVITAAMAWSGFGAVAHAVMRIGPGGFLLMVLCQLLVDGVLGLAWSAAVPEIGFLKLTGARMVRDAAASCLPFSQLGGFVIGIRATCSVRGAGKRKVDLPEAATANLVDITTEVMGQVAFVLLAVGCLAAHQRNSPLVIPVIIGAVFLMMGAAGFVWTQRHGGSLFRHLGNKLTSNILAQWQDILLNSADEVQQRMEAVWSRPLRIALSAFYHLIGWISSAGMLWLTAGFLGVHLNLVNAIAIEGVTCAVLSMGFLVPGNLGVQEGAYIALGHAFGIDASVSLGLSLLRRGRELSIGVPVLLVWQMLEMRGLRKLPASKDGAQKPEVIEEADFSAVKE